MARNPNIRVEKMSEQVSYRCLRNKVLRMSMYCTSTCTVQVSLDCNPADGYPIQKLTTFLHTICIDTVNLQDVGDACHC